jgi:ribose-phosphate pyrophosphokinase
MNGEYKILSGSSNEELAIEICNYLKVKLTPMKRTRFKDGEIYVQIEENIRGCDVYIVQSLSTPVNDHLMELLLIMDACRRASAKRINLVIPYYGYARQDRKNKPRVPISAAVVAIVLEAVGLDKLIALDLHCGQIQGFFKVPVDNLNGAKVLVEYCSQIKNLDNCCIVSPDAGGVERSLNFRKYFAEQNKDLKLSTAMMSKHREKSNEVETMELVGNVEDKDCIIIDDMIDTAGTLCFAAKILKEHGAKRVFACASHALLNGDALENINKSELENVIVIDSIKPTKEKLENKKIKYVTCSKLLGEAIRRNHNEESISSIF